MTTMPKLSKRAKEDLVISQALAILETRMRRKAILLGDPVNVIQHVKLSIGNAEHEVFGVFFLDIKNRLIRNEKMFRGTIAHTSVYPREVVKAALKCNASAMIIYHNHPSGVCEPSPADKMLTTALKTACALVDVRVLDHIIVSTDGHFSFAQHGII